MNGSIQTRDAMNQSGELPQLAAPNRFDKNFLEILDNSTDIFSKSMKLGRVRGIVCLCDPASFGAKDHGELMRVARELINRDILVILPGGNAGEDGMMPTEFFQDTGDGLAEFCDFIGIAPVVRLGLEADAQPLADFYGRLAAACGIAPTDLPTAAVAGLPFADHDDRLGSLFTLAGNAQETADLVDRSIHDKRERIEWCDRCGGHFSPFS